MAGCRHKKVRRLDGWWECLGCFGRLKHQPKKAEVMAPDLVVTRYGSILLLSYGTESGRLWLHEHIDVEHSQTLGTAVAVQPRYIANILDEATRDGLLVREG